MPVNIAAEMERIRLRYKSNPFRTPDYLAESSMPEMSLSLDNENDDAENKWSDSLDNERLPSADIPSEWSLSLENENDKKESESVSSPDINDLASRSHYISPEYNNSLYNESDHSGLTQTPAASCKGHICPAEEEHAARAFNTADAVCAEEIEISTTGTSDRTPHRSVSTDQSTFLPAQKSAETGGTEQEIVSAGTSLSLDNENDKRPSPSLPPHANITRIHAQIFHRINDPNNKRRGDRNVKLYVWTTDDRDLLNDHDAMDAQMVFNLVSPDTFIKAVRLNKKNGTLIDDFANVLEGIGKQMKEENKKKLSSIQESSSLAYLKVKGSSTGVSGTQIKPSQLCTVHWVKQDDGSYAPLITLWWLTTGEHQEIDCFKLTKNTFKSTAAEFAGYYDPLDYNSYRKKKTKRKENVE